MKWKYLGNFRISAYYIDLESRYAGTGSVSINVQRLDGEIQSLSVNRGLITDLGGIYMQGTARLDSGVLIHPEKAWLGQYILKATGESLVYLNRPDLGIIGFVPRRFWDRYEETGSGRIRDRMLLQMQGKTYAWDPAIIGFAINPDALYIEGPGARLIPGASAAIPRDLLIGSEIYIDGLSTPGGSESGLFLTATDHGGLINGFHIDLFVGEGYQSYLAWQQSGALNQCYDMWQAVPDKESQGMQ